MEKKKDGKPRSCPRALLSMVLTPSFFLLFPEEVSTYLSPQTAGRFLNPLLPPHPNHSLCSRCPRRFLQTDVSPCSSWESVAGSVSTCHTLKLSAHHPANASGPQGSLLSTCTAQCRVYTPTPGRMSPSRQRQTKPSCSWKDFPQRKRCRNIIA